MLLIRTLFGLLRQTKEFEELFTDMITVDTKKKRLMVALDGEVTEMETPLNYRIRAGALRVLIPRPEVPVENA
jgi:diacylglycerol kinase family enzyme